MSSFTKIAPQKPITGTRTSLQNGQTITSSGNSSLDHILGGGVPIGSVLLIEEDEFVTYSRVLAKYFLAEGISCGHSIFMGSLDEDVHELIKKLPKPIEDYSEMPANSSSHLISDQLNANSDEMRIAWRYQNLPKINSEQSTKVGHNFNLLEQIDNEILKTSDITYWKHNEPAGKAQFIDNSLFENPKYHNILQNIFTLVGMEKFSNNEKLVIKNKSILRICITSLGSPLWYEKDFTKDFIKFLTILKSIVRNNLCVCFLTIPMHLIALLDERLIHCIRNLADFAVELKSFAGTDKESNPIFKEYNGLLNIKKLTAINSLAVFTPKTVDLAFKLRRKKFIIEKLHLPPELQEEQQEYGDIKPSLSCGSTEKHLLEF